MTYREFISNKYSPIEVIDRLIAAGLGNRKPQWTITEAEFATAMALPAVDLKGTLEPAFKHYRGYQYPREPHVEPMTGWKRRRHRRDETETLFPTETFRVAGSTRRAILRAE